MNVLVLSARSHLIYLSYLNFENTKIMKIGVSLATTHRENLKNLIWDFGLSVLWCIDILGWYAGGLNLNTMWEA